MKTLHLSCSQLRTFLFSVEKKIELSYKTLGFATTKLGKLLMALFFFRIKPMDFTSFVRFKATWRLNVQSQIQKLATIVLNIEIADWLTWKRAEWFWAKKVLV